MKQDLPLVSVIIPAYNAGNFIEEAIASVLNQNHANIELLLIDDGSTDNTLDIIKKYEDGIGIKALQHDSGKNMGVSKSRKLGFDHAKGEFIAFLDADDIFYPEKLKEQLEVFSRYKEVILVHSKVEILNETKSNFNNEFALSDKDEIYNLYQDDNWLYSNKICNSTVLVKNSVLQSIEFGLPQLFQFEDWLLWSLLAHKGSFYYQNTPHIKYRLHQNSATASILNNKLIHSYSKIEYLLSFYVLNDCKVDEFQILNQLDKTLVQLFNIYSKEFNRNGRSKKISQSFFDNDTFSEKRYKELQIENLKLRNQLNNLQESRTFRVLKMLKKIMKLR